MMKLSHAIHNRWTVKELLKEKYCKWYKKTVDLSLVVLKTCPIFLSGDVG